MGITAEDILDHYPDLLPATLDELQRWEIVEGLDLIAEHCTCNDWTEAQVTNLSGFARLWCTDEDRLALFSGVTRSRNIHNIKLFHSSPITQMIMDSVNKVEAL